MAEITKLTDKGQTIWPATTTTAVIDPETTETLADLLKLAFPVETAMTTDEKVITIGSPTEITYSWHTELAGKDITDECYYIFNGEEVEGSSYVETYTPASPTAIKRTLKTIYKGREIESEAIVYSVHPSYYGVVSKDDELNDETILGVEGIMISNDKAVSIKGINLDNQCFVYAYPSYLGELESVKDMNGFEHYGFEGCGFGFIEVMIGNVSYNVYALKDPCTADKFGYIFA